MVKFFLSITFSILVILNTSAQQMADMATHMDAGKIPGSNIATDRKSVAIKYTLEFYGNSPASNPVFEEEHFLGGEISAKWNLFQQSYKHVYEQSVGLSGTTVEIRKPVVFNAVTKVNNYYKKALKKEDVNKDVACGILSHILDCANLLCYENDTKNIEADIKEAKTVEDIVKVFASIRINYH